MPYTCVKRDLHPGTRQPIHDGSYLLFRALRSEVESALASDKINDDPTLPGVWNDGRQHESGRETGDDWFVWQPTIGPASPLRPGKRSTKDVQRGLGLGLAALAAQLCWQVPPRR